MSKDSTVTLMTEGDYRKQLLVFAVPVFFGDLFQVLYSVVDSIVVGNYLGAQSLAAITSVGSLTGLMIGIFLGFGTGTSVVTGQMIGAGDDEKTSHAVHSTIALGIVFSVILTMIGVFFSRTFLTWMATPEDVIDLASLYLKIYFTGSFALIFYNLLTGILQAAGNSRDPLIYLIVASIMNIVLDILFVAGFHMGVGGAALATVIAQTTAALLAFIKLLRTDTSVKIIPKKIRFEKETTKEILKIGLPNSIEWAVIDLANVMIQSYINSFGALAIAGYGAASRIEGFVFIPLAAMRAALSTFVSQNFGAKNCERIRKGVRFGIASGVSLIFVIGVIVFLNAEALISLFNTDPEVIFYGAMRVKSCAVFFTILGLSNILAAVVTSLGKPVVSMVTMLVCWCGVRVTVLSTIGKVWHDFRLICALYPFTWTLSTIVILIAYRYLIKKMILEEQTEG